jgi:hypothetical protein
MTSRTRRLMVALSAAPLAAAAIALVGAQAAYADDNSHDGTAHADHHHKKQHKDGDKNEMGDVMDDLPIVSDRQVKRDITPVDWSR